MHTFTNAEIFGWAYIALLLGFAAGTWFGIEVATAPEYPEDVKGRRLAAMTAIADAADANPEAIPRPPDHVDAVIREITSRQRRDVGRSGVPGRFR